LKVCGWSLVDDKKPPAVPNREGRNRLTDEEKDWDLKSQEL
jgi:hypothetical protein